MSDKKSAQSKVKRASKKASSADADKAVSKSRAREGAGSGTLVAETADAVEFSDAEFFRRLMMLEDKGFVESAYQLFLGRDADTSGLASFMARLQRGEGRLAILAAFEGSKERQQRKIAVPKEVREAIAAGTHPYILNELLELSDVPFVRMAFRTVLKREPDPSGLETYTNMIRSGGARLLMLWHLRTSGEGREVQADVPGLDAAIARYHRLAIPIVGPLLRKFGYGKERPQLSKLIRRVEGQLDYFKATPLGSSMAGMLPSTRPAWVETLKVGGRALAGATEKSIKISGNAALPARAWSNPEGIQRILILKLDHMGDFFVSVRPMCMLRDAWPNVHITLVCGPWNVALAQQLGIFDEIVPYRFFTAKTGEEEFNWDAQDWIARCDGIRQLDLGSFDLAIDFRHDSDTRPCLLQVQSKYRIGFASPGGPLPPTPPLDLFLLEIPPDHRDQLHAESRIVALAALIIETFCPPVEHPIRRLLKKDGSGPVPFDGKRDYVILAPGAGSPNRTWSPDNFVLLMHRIRDELKLGMVLIGGPSEATVNGAIAAEFDAADCVNMTGGSLTELPNLVEDALLFVGNDTGGGHLAALLGTPTLSIYGGVSDPRVWQPIGPKVSIVHSQTPCSYCHINLRKDCHFDLRCMTEITVDDAFKEFVRLLRTWNPDKAPVMISTDQVGA